jgi:outer membrane protein insertion porin family
MDLENQTDAALLPEHYDQEADERAPITRDRRINALIVKGNTLIPTQAILNRIPFKKGEIFDPNKTRRLINNLYYDLKRFRNISIFGEYVGDDAINLHIIVEEKQPLKEVVFEGNKQLTEKEIREKINFSEIPAVDQEELKRYAMSIKKLYREKGYHNTDISTSLQTDAAGKAIATFSITEHPRAIVKRIRFKGNCNVRDKQLRSILFTKEDWIVGFMDKSGTYQPERLEGDKHVIEQYYQNHGYLNAKVVDAQVDIDNNCNVTITYEIQEGDCYTVESVKAPGNDILKDEYLEQIIPIRPGDIYSREKIVDAIKSLEFAWGDLGFVYAHIEPSIQPNEDTKTVSLAFYTEQGKPVTLNRLTIKGNKKTRDKIIRRKIALEEGCLITTRFMELSKTRVESLGYFDQREGVNWKMTRLSDDLADLDLFVKEIKTGSAHVQLGFGGSAASINSASTGVSVEGTIADTNLFGSGIKMNLTGRFGTDEKTILFNITQPWMFDKPIYGALDLYHKRVGYEELRLTRPVNEKYTGGMLTAGFVTGSRHYFFNDSYMRLALGIDDVHYEGNTGNTTCETLPRAFIRGLNTPEEVVAAQTAYDIILAKEFSSGTYSTLSINVGKDAKNHPMHPTRGYSWLGRAVAAAPVLKSCIGFYKADLDMCWYTPLIGEFDLILKMRGYFGYVAPFNNRIVPYRELFHIGGPASVRGFLFGQIGPQFGVFKNDTFVSDSIGGKKAFFLSTELIFPVTQDFSIKGVVFYDGGAGWDNPYAHCVPCEFIFNNAFCYRHAIGVGVRLLNPMPIKVDWGFKLDPRKGEPVSEVHFGMTYDW